MIGSSHFSTGDGKQQTPEQARKQFTSTKTASYDYKGNPTRSMVDVRLK